MNIPEEWLDTSDPLESRAFYELMQQYRHADPTDQEEVIRAFDDVKAFVRTQVQTP